MPDAAPKDWNVGDAAPKLAEAKSSGEPGWKWRRFIIFPVVGFACWQLHLLRGDADTQVNQMVASGWLWLIGVLVVAYAGFATFQDVVAIWRTGTALPYAPNSDAGRIGQPVNPPPGGAP